MVMIMVDIMVTIMMMITVMTRGRGNIRAHLRPKNETNGPRAVTVGGGSLYLFSSVKLCVCHTVHFTVRLYIHRRILVLILIFYTVCRTVYFTVRLYIHWGHSGRRIWSVDTKVICRRCQQPELSPEMIKLTRSLANTKLKQTQEQLSGLSIV